MLPKLANFSYLIFPCLSPDAKSAPSGLTRIERTPFLSSYVVSVLSVAPAVDKQTKNLKI